MSSATIRVSLCLLAINLLASSICAAPEAQERFFRHVEAKDTASLLESMGASLRDEIDEPVLMAWVAGFKKHLGRVNEIERLDWKSSLSLKGVMSETTCKIICELGVAESRVTTLDGKIVGFNVQSDKLSNWFEGLSSSKLYETKGEAFIEAFMNGEGERSHAMCHPALRAAVPLDQLNEMIVKVKEKTGTCVRTEVQRVQFESTKNGDYLFIDFEVEGVDATIECRLKFQFDGLKGYLLGFNFDWE